MSSKSNPSEALSLSQRCINALEDVKAQEITHLNVQHLSTLMDHIIIVTATSTQHAKALAQNLTDEAKSHQIPILGIEGLNSPEWVLVDLGDVVVHIMLAPVREFYALEKLWNIPTPTSHT